jgi:hypothetical protein
LRVPSEACNLATIDRDKLYLEHLLPNLTFALLWPHISLRTLPDSIKVVRQILILFVEVRILVGQLKKELYSLDLDHRNCISANSLNSIGEVIGNEYKRNDIVYSLNIL